MRQQTRKIITLLFLLQILYMTEQQHKQQFSLQRVYIKDLSFEAPLGVMAFNQKWKPTINQQLDTKIEKIQDDHYEVTLTITLTATIEEQTAFLVEIHQAGLFFIIDISLKFIMIDRFYRCTSLSLRKP